MSSIYNFSIFQGASFQANLNIRDSLGAYQNLSGWGCSGQIRYSYGSDAVLLNLSPTVDPSYVSGLIIINIPSTGTAALPCGKFPFDIEIGSTNNNVIKVLYGRISVDPEVTR